MNSETKTIVAALDADAPLPREVIDALAGSMNDYDCENWDYFVGLAIVRRFRRELDKASVAAG
jgi:hypothetical protein